MWLMDSYFGKPEAYFISEGEIPPEENGADFPEKDRKRADRRKRSVNASLKRKAKSVAIGRTCYKDRPHRGRTDTPGSFPSLHQYSKNKIHCSCAMCRFGGWDRNEKTHSDLMREEAMRYRLKDHYISLEYWDEYEYDPDDYNRWADAPGRLPRRLRTA